MKRQPATTTAAFAPSLVSDWTRELWEAEAKFTPFVGSLNNMKFYIEVAKPAARRPKTKAVRKPSVTH